MKVNLDSEAGSVTVIVAIFTSALVLVTSIALAVDAGIIYVERRTVVNAAQSAALALARECIERPSTCANSNPAQSLANSKSKGLGMGDVKFAALIGLALSWISFPAGLFGLGLAFIASSFFSLLLYLVRRNSFNRVIPFAPFMLLGLVFFQFGTLL